MKKLFKSFVYAFSGIVAAVKSERNMRIHLIAVIYVTAFSLFYDLTRAEYAILVLTFSSVIACELINTTVEKAVDLSSPEKNETAKFAKDAAAGAVLVTAIFAVIVGVLLFGDIAVIKSIFEYYASHLLALAGLIISVILACIFIFKTDERNKK